MRRATSATPRISLLRAIMISYLFCGSGRYALHDFFINENIRSSDRNTVISRPPVIGNMRKISNAIVRSRIHPILSQQRTLGDSPHILCKPEGRRHERRAVSFAASKTGAGSSVVGEKAETRLGGSLHDFKRTAGENVFRHLPVRRRRRFRSRTDSAAPLHLRPFPRTGLCTTLQGATSLHPPPSASPVRTTAENGQKSSRSRPAGKSMRAERCPQKIGPLRSAPPATEHSPTKPRKTYAVRPGEA